MKKKFHIIYKYLFGLIIVFTCVFLVELGLKKTLGNPENAYHFFNQVTIGGEDYHKLLTNKLELFYGELIIPVEKKDTFRVFVFGGSVSAIFPVNTLEKYLKNTIPDQTLEIYNIGVGGADSYDVYLLFIEAIEFDPDLVIVLSGNNEFHFPINNVFRNNRPDIIKIKRILNGIWCYKLMSSLLKRYILNNAESEHGPSVEKTIRDAQFYNNISNMVNIAEDKKVPIVLGTLPVNYKALPWNNINLFWKILYEQDGFMGKVYLDIGQYDKALKLFNKMKEKHPTNPWIYYYLAHAYENLKDYKKAKEAYVNAIEYDIPGSRSKPSRNEILRNICLKGYATIIDFEKTFMELMPHAISDYNYFGDGCHFNILFYEVLADMIAMAYYENYGGKEYTIKDPHDNMKILQQVKISMDKEYYTELFDDIIANSILFGMEELTYIDPVILSEIYQKHPGIVNKYKIKDAFFERMSSLNINMSVDSEKPWLEFLFVNAEMYRIKGDYSSAIMYYNMVDKTKLPIKLSVLLFRGVAYYLNGEIEAARRDFLKVIEMNQKFYWLKDFNI